MLALTKEERLALVCLGAVLLLGILTHYFSKTNPAIRNFLNSSGREIPRHLKVDVNRATYDDLVNIPYIGEKTARVILSLRESQGKFTDLNEIRYIPGIGKSKFDMIKKYLTMTP